MGSEFPKLEDLETWKRCRELRIDFNNFTKSLPPEEKYRLTDQILRASRSVTNNIAEGYGRFHFQENIQYLRQSRGSVYECIDHLYVAFDSGHMSKESFDNLYNKCNECLKLINGYIKFLKNKKIENDNSRQ